MLGMRSPSEEQLAVARHMTHSVGIWREGGRDAGVRTCKGV